MVAVSSSGGGGGGPLAHPPLLARGGGDGSLIRLDEMRRTCKNGFVRDTAAGTFFCGKVKSEWNMPAVCKNCSV